MAEYQNIFTRVQVRGPIYIGPPLVNTSYPRSKKAFYSHIAGLLGDAQIGPIYLGVTGVASLICSLPASSRGLRSSRRPLATDCISRLWRRAAGGSWPGSS